MEGQQIVHAEIPVLAWREGDQTVVYTPALELSSFGDDEASALNNFSEAVELFFETATERRVVASLLEELGWERLGSDWKPVSAALPGGRSVSVQFSVPTDC